jgi:hypothetical protein
METLSQEMLDALSAFQREWGDVEYEYYAIPVTYRPKSRGQAGGHSRPTMYIERYTCSQDEYEKGKEQSKRLATQAFLGEYKGSYTDFQRRVKKPGWREKLIEYLKAEQESH